MWLTALLCGLTVVLYLWSAWPHILAGCSRKGDYALLELETLRAAQEWVLLGPYSRLGFRHPGPLVFYLYAAVDSLCGDWLPTAGAMMLAQLLMNFALLSASAILLASVTRRIAPGALLLAGVLLIEPVVRSNMLRDVWNPSVTVCAVVAALVAMAGVVSGVRWALPLVVIGAAIALSHHLGTVGVLLPCVLATAFVWWRSGVGLAPFSHPVATGFALLVALVAAAPPLFEALTEPGFGNLAAVLRGLRSSEGAVEPGALRYLAVFFAQPLGVRGEWVYLPFLLLLILPWVSSFSEQPFLRALRALVLVSVLAGVVIALQMKGRRPQYLLYPMYGVAVLAGVLSALALVQRVRGLAPILPALSLVAIAVQLSTVAMRATPLRQCPVRYQQFASQLVEDAPVRLAVESLDRWPDMAALLLELYRREVEVCVDPRWHYVVGRRFACAERHNGGAGHGADRTTVTVVRGAAGLDVVVSGRHGEQAAPRAG